VAITDKMVKTKEIPNIRLGALDPPLLAPLLVMPRLILRSFNKYSVLDDNKRPQHAMAPQTMDSSKKSEEMLVLNPR
jgi:hypothetical protein